MTEEKENCKFQQNYNVFGLDDKPCCYLYHNYCNEIENCYFKRCKNLEQENEELKEEIKHWQMEHREGCSKRDWAYEQAKKKSNKYKQALEEISEIAKDIIENDVYENSDIKAEKILNKINEVLK